MFSLSPRIQVPWAQPRGMSAPLTIIAGVGNTVTPFPVGGRVLRATATTCAPSTATQSTVIAALARLRRLRRLRRRLRRPLP